MTDQTTTIPKGWKMTTLGEVGVTVTGKTPSKNNPEDWGDFLDFITPTDISSDSKYLKNVARKLSEEGANRFKRMIIPPKSVVVTCIGSDMGKVVMNKNKALTNQQINSIRVNSENDKDYIFYLLRDSYSILRNIAVGGSTMPILNKTTFESLEFLTPPLPEQRAIAAVLSSFDDKIELLREQNKTLEATAQTIFKEWFVNFNFPGADGKPYKTNGGKMIDSELGAIPEGWRVGTVNEVIERFSITYRCDQDDLSPKGKTPIFDQGTNGLYGYTERDADFQASTENPVILFTNHTCNMWFVNYPFCAIQNVIPFRGNAKYSTYFVFYMTLGKIKFIEYKGHWPDFEQKKYIIPKPEIANRFAEFIKPLQYKIWNNNSQIQTLSKIRDTLLPKLMKGEVRVKGFKD